jgi:uncharacterized protein (TIGR01777 family)
MKVVVAGGTGFIGKPLVAALRELGHDVTVLSRHREGEQSLVWDGKSVGPWTSALDGADALINLTGANISQRWNDEGKKQIVRSRVDSCHALGLAVRTVATPPRIWVQGSACGYYGDTGENLVDEASPAGTGFLAETCVAWEAAAREAANGQALSFVRTGIVLGRGGGALDPLEKLAKAFLGGAAGSGRQFMPWIHLDDIVGIFVWALEKEFSGPVNGVQPNPARNADLMAAVRRALGRPWSPPAPVFGIKLVEAIAGIPSELILGSQRVTTTILPGQYPFKYTDLDQAVKAALS